MERQIPDARWINRKLDIRRVAAEMGILGDGNRYHCWHPESHNNGDRDPSVGYWETGNRLRCFVCDRPAVGVIDLVADLKGIDAGAAIRLIAERFQVPRIPARKPVEESRRRLLNGVTDPITYLVRSHIFASLSEAGRMIAPTLWAFASDSTMSTSEPKRVKISYRALSRYSGLSSPNAVSKGLDELEVIGWLRREQNHVGFIRDTSAYILTPFSEAVEQMGHSLALEEQFAIEYERAESQRRRADRQRAFRQKGREAITPLSNE